MRTTIEEAIEISSKIKESITKLCDVYQQMPSLIENEHNSIKNSDLDQIELITKEKLELGEFLDNNYVALKNCSRELESLHRKLDYDAPALKINTVSESIDAIQKIIAKHTPETEGLKILEHIQSEIIESFEQFVEIKNHIKPKIEQNRYLITKLLQNRQDNYRFWQEVTNEVMLPYNQGGQQKTTKPASILNVKA